MPELSGIFSQCVCYLVVLIKHCDSFTRDTVKRKRKTEIERGEGIKKEKYMITRVFAKLVANV